MNFRLVSFGLAASAAMGAAGLSLDGAWRLSYWPEPDGGAIRSLPVGVPVERVKATVPGNVEIDLEAAGKIDDPRLGSNVYKLRPFEGYQWLYEREFDAPALKP